jgi:hypothetical protein
MCEDARIYKPQTLDFFLVFETLRPALGRTLPPI